jgi:quinol monooxygenase YgiN
MIYVVATLVSKQGSRASLLEAFTKVVPAVLAEDGCVEYQAVIDADSAETRYGEDTFVVLEKWASIEALDAHGKGPILAGFVESAKPYLSTVTVNVLKAVG